jgi:hypothetical protein
MLDDDEKGVPLVLRGWDRIWGVTEGGGVAPPSEEGDGEESATFLVVLF